MIWSCLTNICKGAHGWFSNHFIHSGVDTGNILQSAMIKLTPALLDDFRSKVSTVMARFDSCHGFCVKR